MANAVSITVQGPNTDEARMKQAASAFGRAGGLAGKGSPARRNAARKASTASPHSGRPISPAAIEAAEAFLACDPTAARRDIESMGLVRAARHNLAIAREQVERGDTRWVGVTYGAMRQALRSVR